MAKPKTRNHLVVGKNSKSYDDKHPENPVSLRPIRDAIAAMPKVLTGGRVAPDHKRISFLRHLGYLPRLDIARGISMIARKG